MQSLKQSVRYLHIGHFYHTVHHHIDIGYQKNLSCNYISFADNKHILNHWITFVSEFPLHHNDNLLHNARKERTNTTWLITHAGCVNNKSRSGETLWPLKKSPRLGYNCKINWKINWKIFWVVRIFLLLNFYRR